MLLTNACDSQRGFGVCCNGAILSTAVSTCAMCSYMAACPVFAFAGEDPSTRVAVATTAAAAAKIKAAMTRRAPIAAADSFNWKRQ